MEALTMPKINANVDPFAAGKDMRALYAEKEVSVETTPEFGGKPEIDAGEFALASTDWNTVAKLAPLHKHALLDDFAGGRGGVESHPVMRDGNRLVRIVLAQLSTNAFDLPWVSDAKVAAAIADYKRRRQPYADHEITDEEARREIYEPAPKAFLDVGKPKWARGEDPPDVDWTQLSALVIIESRIRNPKKEADARAKRDADAEKETKPDAKKPVRSRTQPTTTPEG
jgi:hypothetical protein